MLKIRIALAAEYDLAESSRYYEDQASNLGFDFLEDVNVALNRIIENPEAYTEVRKGIRRSLLNRFPFAVYYAIEPECIQVIGVLHLHRHPQAWIDRT